MSGTTKSGFTLIELMVVIAIIALMAAAVVPRLGVRPLQRRMQFATDLSALIGLGWQQALMTNTFHRITFDFEKRQFTLQADESAGQDQKEVFKEVKNPYFISTQSIDDAFTIKQFFIEGYDEVQRFVGKKLQKVYFFIVPEGLVQPVIINLVDNNDLDEKGRGRQFGVVVNPFSGECVYHDSFQKP